MTVISGILMVVVWLVFVAVAAWDSERIYNRRQQR